MLYAHTCTLEQERSDVAVKMQALPKDLLTYSTLRKSLHPVMLPPSRKLGHLHKRQFFFSLLERFTSGKGMTTQQICCTAVTKQRCVCKREREREQIKGSSFKRVYI